MQSHVAVFDPDGITPEGKVFIQDERYFEARRRGVVFLPVVDDLKPRTSLSSWAKFSYGDGPFASGIVPGYLGRGALWLERGRGSVAWAALLRHIPLVQREGILRLVGDPSQSPLVQAPVSDDARNRASLGRPAGSGETHTIITGATNCQTAMEGVFAFALHGYARDCRLAWLALSQTE